MKKLTEAPPPPPQSGPATAAAPAAPAAAAPPAAAPAAPAAPTSKKPGLGSRVANAVKSPFKLAGDHLGAMLGSASAVGRLDLRIAHGDMMDRLYRWMAASNLRPTPRNIIDFVRETYGENAAQMTIKMFKEGGVDTSGGTTTGAPAAAPTAAGSTTPPPAGPAPAASKPAAPAPAAPKPPSLPLTPAVKSDLEGLADNLLKLESSRLNAALTQVASEIRKRHPTQADAALKEIRAQFITDKETARRWHSQNGNKAFGLNEGRDAARRMIGRPLEERRVIVNRVHALLEANKSSTTEAGQIATSLRETMKTGVSLREAWSVLLTEANAKSMDDEIDRATLDQITKALAGGLVRANIIHVNNRYADNRAGSGVTSIGGGGGYSDVPRPTRQAPPAAPASDVDDENDSQESRGDDLLNVKVNRRKMQAPLQNANIIASDQALMIAQLASFYGPQDFVQFKGKAEQTARSDSYAEAMMKDPYLAVFAIVKALQ